MNWSAVICLWLGALALTPGAVWAVSGKPVFRKEADPDVRDEGLILMLLGVALLFLAARLW
jgi:hypothetical protein